MRPIDFNRGTSREATILRDLQAALESNRGRHGCDRVPLSMKRRRPHRIFAAAVLLLGALGFAVPQSAAAQQFTDAMVKRALSHEMNSARDPQHPMRYTPRKASPRLTQTKEIFETRDGNVARLVRLNDQPLTADDAAKEEARLNALLAEPGRQQRRKQSEDADTARAMKVLRVLPQAFLYQFSGVSEGPTGRTARFAFKPNPKFDPPDLETQVLKSMTGEIWIDTQHERVVRLEGHLDDDVDFGWGILGRLYKGGWVVIEQADVNGGQWRITRFQMKMQGRVVFKNKSFDTLEETHSYTPLPVGLGYAKAIEMLRGGAVASGKAM